MNEYDVFLKLRSDRESAARAYRRHQLAQEAMATSDAHPNWFRLVFNAVSQQIVKLIARRVASVESTCPTPPCTETLPAS